VLKNYSSELGSGSVSQLGSTVEYWYSPQWRLSADSQILCTRLSDNRLHSPSR